MLLQLEGVRTHLSTRAGMVKALDGVDLAVARGEMLGVVGESGSGKTMTALSIMGLLPPRGRIVDGHIWFEGEDLAQKSEHEMERIRGRGIAMIPQDPMTSLNPVYTIGDQLAESIHKAGPITKAAASQRAIELLREMNIADPAARLSNYPHQMSGGMRQRVVGAMAIAGVPSLLIADEPTTSLDATVQLQYLHLLKRVQERTGVAVIFITHDFGIVAKICDRVAVMYAGRIVESGPVREVFAAPSHPYTQALIASLPDLNETLARLPTVEGQPPEPLDLPAGCSFAPRCPFAFERCSEMPPMLPVSDRHSARCWLLEPAIR
jgi:oligopeptide/dipeptide ABC transporter ATP-binding protein